MAASALARQLQNLKTPQTTQLRERKGRDSFLYDYREAQTIDCDTHHTVALSGLQELCNINTELERFKKTLFSDTSKSFERGLQSSAANAELDIEIRSFLYQGIAPFFLLGSSHKAFEWLIYKYNINEYNVDDLLSAVLPYHETRLFTRVVQICREVHLPSSKWHWLESSSKAGTPVPKFTIIQHCVSDLDFLRLLCNSANVCAQISQHVSVVISFCTAIFIGTLGLSTKERVTHIILEYISNGFSKGTSSTTLASGFTVMAYLATKVRLSDSVLEKLLIKAGKRIKSRATSARDYLRLLVVIVRTQETTSLAPEVVKPIPVEILATLQTKAELKLLGVVIATYIKNISAMDNSKLSQVVETAYFDEEGIEIAIRAIAEVMKNKPSVEEKTKLKATLSVLEKRFPSEVDRAMTIVKYAPLSELLTSAIFTGLSTEASVFAQLHHPSNSVRISALDRLRKDSKKVIAELDDRTSPLLATGLSANLKSQNIDVLRNTLQCKDLLIHLLPKRVIVDDLSTILEICNNQESGTAPEEHITNVRRLKHSALQLLCELNSTATKMYEATVLEELLPVRDESVPAVIDFVSSSNLPSSLKEFGEKCASNLLSDTNAADAFDSIVESATHFAVTTDHIIFELLTESTDNIARVAFNLSTTYKVMKTCKSFSVVNRLVISQLRNIMRLKKSGCKVKRNIKNFEGTPSLVSIQPYLKTIGKGSLPVQMIIAFGSEVSKTLIAPDEKVGSKWHWHLETAQSNYVVAVFEFLSEYASEGKSRDLFQMALIDFTKSVYQFAGISFLSSRWVSDDPVLQLRSLMLSLSVTKPKDFECEDLLSLLSAMSSRHLAVRQCATALMETKVDFKKFNIDKSQILQDEHFMSQLFASWLNAKNINTVFGTPRCDWKKVIFEALNTDSLPLKFKKSLLLVILDVKDLSTLRNLQPFIVDLLKNSKLRSADEMVEMTSAMLLESFVEAAPEDCEEMISLTFKLMESQGSSCRKRLSRGWFTRIANEDTKVLVINKLLEVGSTDLKRRLKKLCSDGGILSKVIDSLTTNNESSLGRTAKRRRTQTIIARSPFTMNNEWQKVTHILEAIQTGVEFSNSAVLMSTLFELLRLTFCGEEESSTEYFRKLLMGGIDACLLQVDTDSNKFDLHTIIDSFRHHKTKENQCQALHLISMVSEHFKKEILQNIVLIFGYIGSSLMKCNEDYALTTLSESMNALIPTIVSEEQSVHDSVVDVFIDSLLDIPAHRRLTLFTTLASLVNSSSVLWYISARLLERSIRKDVGHMVEETYASFAAEVVSNSALPSQLEALNSLLLFAIALDNGQLIFENRKFSLSDYERRELLQASSQAIVRVLQGDKFATAVASTAWPEVEPLFETFLKNLLSAVDVAAKKTEKRKSYSSSNKLLLRSLYKILGKVNCLLPNARMTNIIQKLLKSSSLAVRKIALQLLNAKLSKDTASKLEVELLRMLMVNVRDIVKSTCASPNEANLAISQTALLSTKMLAKHLENDDESQDLLEEVLSVVMGVLDTNTKHPAFSASTIIAVTQLSLSLNNRAIPFLTTVVPTLLKFLRSDAQLVVFTAASCMSKITKRFAKFLSPYVAQIIIQICRINFSDKADEKMSFSSKFKSIRKNIAALVPMRSVFDALEQIYEELENDEEALCVFLTLVGSVCSKGVPEELESERPKFQKFMWRALDFRGDHESTSERVEDVENNCVRALVSYFPKLSEGSFKQFYFKLYDWATSAQKGKSSLRLITFYKLSEALADVLQSLFCAFAAPYIHSNCILQLDRFNSSKNALEGESLEVAHAVITHVLGTLSKCFLYDINGIYATKTRVEQLTDSVIDQISNLSLDAPDLYEKRVTEGVSKAVEFMVRAVSDNLVVRNLHHKLLMKTRESSPKIRYYALHVVHRLIQSMGEEYVSLLPEAVPFLSELHEDDSDDIQNLLKVIFSHVEQVVGEPISNYL